MAVVEVTTNGKRVLAKIPYDKGEGPRAAKRVSGYHWDPDGKVWDYPLTMDTCYALRNQFGAALKILAPLATWARSELAKGERLEAIRDGSAVSLRTVEAHAPALYAALQDRSYQMIGAAFLKEGGGILGDQPGLGKTLQTLGTLLDAGCKEILVGCPRTATRTVWAREVNRWAPLIMPFVAQGTHAQREQVMQAFADMPYDGPKMLIINNEMMRAKREEVCPDGILPDAKGKFPYSCSLSPHKHKYKTIPDWPFLHERMWDAIVIDESHGMLASTANIQSKRITQGRYGAVNLRRRIRDGGLPIALSGTPFRSDLAKAWGTLNWIAPKDFSSFWRFARTHFEVRDAGDIGPDGKMLHGTWVGKEPLNIDRFNAALRPYYLARTKQEAAPDLPPIIWAGTPGEDGGVNGVWLDMEPKQAKAYSDMQKWAKAYVDGGSIRATGILAEITRLRQFACSYGQIDGPGHFVPGMPSNKVDWIIEFMKERAGNAGKVVIASSFTQMVELIEHELWREGFPCLTLTGKTKDKDRLALVERFADPDDENRVAIINTKAGGVAITLDAADDFVFTDLPWVSDDEEQAVDRVHRVSRIHQVTAYRLLSVGTVDAWIAGLTDDQRRILASANPEARAMLKEAI